MSKEDGSNDARGAGLARSGVRIGSQSLGAHLGTIMGPEAGAAVGQAASEAAEAVLDIWQQRTQQRVSQTLLRVRELVKRREAKGDKARSDITDGDNESAVALLESIVEAAAESAEERRCEVIANLYASVAFESEVSVEDALLYLRRVRGCSWRQLVALRYIEAEGRQQERESIGAAGAEEEVRIHPVMGAELSELARTHLLIGIGQEDGSVANPSNVMNGGEITSQSASRLRATGLGETLSRLGKLAELVTDEELDAIARDLQSDHRFT